MGIRPEDALAASMKYTAETVAGAGAIAGVPCQIQSITSITGGHRVTFLWADNDGESHTSTMDVMNGEKGADGEKGDPGLNIKSMAINSSGHLIVTYEDDTTEDAGAVPTVQADWNQSDSTADSYIKNKPALGTAAAKDYIPNVAPNNHGLVDGNAVYSAINTALSSVYTPRGELTCAELTSSLLIEANVGNVYEMSDSGTTTALFLQGAGETISVGQNVGIIKTGPDTYLFNLMANAFDLSAYQTKTLVNPITIDGVQYSTVESALNALSISGGGGGGSGHVYGFHIDATESDPATAVTYLEDAVGMIPAGVNYTTGEFSYGSWEGAFFMPRPCMLKDDGTVDYYLDPDDYTKKTDGTASDVADATYAGNAMMEWGQNGKKIWYRIIPDVSGESANVYIADHQVDQYYHAWSFVNNQGTMVDHFYTPIYTGSYDGNGKLRSLSGAATSSLALGHDQAYDVAAAMLNNPGADVLWNTEVFADVILINLLLVLMGKSLNTQTVFGMGNSYGSLQATGTLNDKGLFYGTNTKTVGVKVFGMEHWYGNSWRRYIGHNLLDGEHIYKLTYGTQDGSTQNGYVDTATAADYAGYLSSGITLSSGGYIKGMHFNNGAFFEKTTGGSSSTYYCDNLWNATTGVRQSQRGGSDSTDLQSGAFCEGLDLTPAQTHSRIGSCLSCKPAAVSN